MEACGRKAVPLGVAAFTRPPHPFRYGTLAGPESFARPSMLSGREMPKPISLCVGLHMVRDLGKNRRVQAKGQRMPGDWC